jgi:hypothetical protein
MHVKMVSFSEERTQMRVLKNKMLRKTNELQSEVNKN